MCLDRILTEYASRNGLGVIEPGPDGHYALIFDSRYKVRLSAEGPGTAVISARVGRLADEPGASGEKLDHMLCLATARMRTAAEVLTVSADRRQLLLFRRFATDIPPHAVEAVLTAFVNGLAFWRRAHASGPARSAASPPPPAMHHRMVR